MISKNYTALLIASGLVLVGCAGGGKTNVGNATGGTVTNNLSVGDVCAGMTAGCTTAEKKAAAAAAAATTETATEAAQ